MRRLIGRRTDWLLLFLEAGLATDYVGNAGRCYMFATTHAFCIHLPLVSYLIFCVAIIEAQLISMQFDLRVEVATTYKKEGFVHNSKQEQLVAAAVVASQQIPDADMTMPSVSTQPARVTSQSSRNTRYIVTPSQSGGSCNCP